MRKQCQFQVFKHLTSGKSLTQMQALRLYDCARLATVIHRLRTFMQIETDMIQSRTGGAPYASYRHVESTYSKARKAA